MLFLALAYTDLMYTRFMLKTYGPDIELNPLIPYLVRKLGLDLGVAVGIILPTLCMLYLGINFQPLLEVLVFMRLMLFYLQAKRLRVELASYPKTTYRTS